MRLPFLLHDFTRIIWHSQEAREVWEPRIQRINNVWLGVERRAVLDGVRESCLTFVAPMDLPNASQWAARNGLTVLTLAASALSQQYSSTGLPAIAGQPMQYRVALTRPHLTKRWVDAWTGNGTGRTDNNAIGELLGYPDCCRAFFERVWVNDQGVDTTWEMAQSTQPAIIAHDLVKVTKGHPIEANILLRWLGVRLVPHLPHSFNCEATVKNAREYMSIFEKEDKLALLWLMEMLDWPIEWSALHGIAEVRTPILTISTRTNATRGKLTVRRDGHKYPNEGASGLKFPYRIVTGKVTDKPSFQRSVTPVWELNGFGSEQSMNAAHDVLLSLFDDPIRNYGRSVLDLGSGTGQLLERLKVRGFDRVIGVESDSTRAGASKVPVRRGDLLDTSLWKETYDVIAFMPGRLLEGITPEKAAEVRQALITRGRSVLVYAYGDWLKKYGGLGPLLGATGLGAGDVVTSASGEGVEAALLVFTTSEIEHVENNSAAI